MKIFISWSGEHSKIIASNLADFLKETIQVTDPWISTEDIAKGHQWMNELMVGLQSCQLAIFCLTRSNLDSRWILYEIGAFSNRKESQVYTLLYNVKPDDLSPPLSQFNSTVLNKEDFRKMLLQINQICRTKSNSKLSDESLNNIINKYWEHFINEINVKLSSLQEEPKNDKKLPEFEELLNGMRILKNHILKSNSDEVTKIGDENLTTINSNNDLSQLNNFLDKMDTIWEEEFDIASELIHRDDWKTEKEFQNKLDAFFLKYWNVFNAMIRREVKGDQLESLCNENLKDASILAFEVWHLVVSSRLDFLENIINSDFKKPKSFNKSSIDKFHIELKSITNSVKKYDDRESYFVKIENIKNLNVRVEMLSKSLNYD